MTSVFRRKAERDSRQTEAEKTQTRRVEGVGMEGEAGVE